MASAAQARTRDIVVIGASAGGVETLKALAPTLPDDLPAAIFVVLHLPAGSKSALPGIISRAGPLRAVHPEDGEPIEHGCIYVAPPDHHLGMEDGVVRLSRGPRENGYRPAIDRLFTTAAATYGPRVTGVVLSGALDDGTLGLGDISRVGGATIVQDPDEALYPAMPASAASYVPEADVLPIAAIGARIAELCRARPEAGDGAASETEKAMIEQAPNPESPEYAQSGHVSGFTCPECSGALWEHDEGGILRYRCRVGHAYSEESMLAEQGTALEAGLWSALRALEERVAFCTRLSTRFRHRGSPAAAARYERQAEEARDQARLVRQAVELLSPVGEAQPA